MLPCPCQNDKKTFSNQLGVLKNTVPGDGKPAYF